MTLAEGVLLALSVAVFIYLGVALFKAEWRQILQDPDDTPVQYSRVPDDPRHTTSGCSRRPGRSPPAGWAARTRTAVALRAESLASTVGARQRRRPARTAGLR